MGVGTTPHPPPLIRIFLPHFIAHAQKAYTNVALEMIAPFCIPSTPSPAYGDKFSPSPLPERQPILLLLPSIIRIRYRGYRAYLVLMKNNFNTNVY